MLHDRKKCCPGPPETPGPNTGPKLRAPAVGVGEDINLGMVVVGYTWTPAAGYDESRFKGTLQAGGRQACRRRSLTGRRTNID